MFKEDIRSDVFAAHMSFFEFSNAMHPLGERDENSAIKHVYNSVVAKGYAGKFSQATLEMIRQRPEVEYVEQDQEMYGDAIQNNSPWVCGHHNQHIA